ncbi:MAG: glycosyltransferase family 39 protein [Gammaproteobacteria bacterium]|nr:glycosyltransferase family 39 protein [Gammaproteobacteria bacterium]MBU1655997.1 glycosyltransferase family 39 protein [Gammaproteobacteria bacterium]MBU1962205.1 glycosyltransferase family 39 protein [Gammaproteobacteria bacterium]
MLALLEKQKPNISGSRFAPFLAAILFVLALLPLASNYVTFHPDERHYTNGAIFMMQSGDIISPRARNGEPRFKKPILTYWAVLGSYQILGTSAFASRLPFLLAGAFSIWLTYRMGILLFASRKTALIASMIMASNPLLMMAGVRTNPDMLLALWLLISAFGFLGIMLSLKPSFLRYLAAYVGIGLAVATKGPLPALVFAGVSMGYLRLNPWRRVSLAHILHFPAILLGMAVGVGWFGIIYLLHGETALASFLGDHVGNRIGFQWQEMATHLLAAIASLSLLFIPWFFPALRAHSRHTQATWGDSGDRYRAILGFVLAWVIAIILMSVPVGAFFPRYVLPATPLVALLLAEALNRRSDERPAAWLTGAIYLMGIFLSLLLFGALLIRLAMDPDPLALAEMALALSVVLALLAQGRKCFDLSVTALAASLLMTPLALFLLAQPIVLPDQGSQIAARLEQLDLIGKGSIVYMGEPVPAAKIRIAAGPGLDLNELDQPTAEDVAQSQALILLEERAGSLDVSGMEVVPAGSSWSALPLDSLKKARSLEELRAALGHPDQRHFIAWRSKGYGAP